MSWRRIAGARAPGPWALGRTPAALFLLLLAGVLGVARGLALGRDLVATPVQVQEVKIVLFQAYRIRVQIIVEGQGLAGGDLEVRQERTDGEIFVTISQMHPPGTQPSPQPFKQRLFLEGAFPPGKYTLRVNDYATTFQVR